jgi:hypothetical protein
VVVIQSELVLKTPTEPSLICVFWFAIDLQIYLSSKFVETLETRLQNVCKIEVQSSLFGSVSHSITEFQATENNTR